MKIFVINPGSTSTKWAVYDDDRHVWSGTMKHPVDAINAFENVNAQLPMRIDATLRSLESAGIPLEFDVVIARGGLLRPTPSGVYEVDSLMIDDLRNSPYEHACNLGALIAAEVAAKAGCKALIADPEVVDELMPEARYTGFKAIRRKSVFHALNTKAVARCYARQSGRRYEDVNLIVAHLGGGISVGAHRKGEVVDVNNALNGDGPFSPERAGTLPADQLVELCYSGKYGKAEVKRMLNGRGGLADLLGTTDVAAVVALAEAGRQPEKEVLDAMLYSVAREIGARAVALEGKVDAIIITGGIAHSHYCVEGISRRVGWIAPVIVRAGEDEMNSLAFNALGALRGEFPIKRYNPD